MRFEFMRISCIVVLLFTLGACSSSDGNNDPGSSLGSGGPANPPQVPPQVTPQVPLQITVLAADDSVNGTELWKTDGTAAGTVLVKDINATPGAGSFPSGITKFNGAFYFSADDGVHGSELWKTDGTATGTVMVKDINTQNAREGTNFFHSSFPSGFTQLNGALYFSADDGVHGSELWKTDGTAAGTVLVTDINNADGLGASSGPHEFTEFNGALYFQANAGVRFNGFELFKTDGTEAGTVLVKNIFERSSGSSFPTGFTVFNGALYFSADDGAHGIELWKTDTTGGTVLVKDINTTGTNTGTAGSLPEGFTVFNGALYFGAFDDVNGFALWKTDGTAAGTVLVKSGNYYPSGFTVFNGALYFRFVQAGIAPFCANGVDNFELWKTDGTAAGTVVVKNFNATIGACSSLSTFTEFNGALYFNANDGMHVRELWKSDGTTAGTVLVKDINPAVGADHSILSSSNSFFVLNGALHFYDDDGVNGMELWKSDGTAAGTQLLKDICPGACSGSTGF